MTEEIVAAAMLNLMSVLIDQKKESVTVMYVVDGKIFTIGPFDSEDQATQAAIDAQNEGEFDIRDQYVYLFSDVGLRRVRKWARPTD